METIGGYRVIRRLGAGGMGEVFLARAESAVGMGRPIVIKTLASRYANDREHAARFLDEARLALQLSHKNICTVTHVGQTDGAFFLAMEYVAGRDLRDVLRALRERGRKMSVAAALLVWRELLEALDYAHRFVDPRTGRSLGIVHRDVSPSNVMMSLEGEVKLIDFGHAMSTLKEERTAAGVIIGKVGYMAPEQARGDAVDERTDIYSAAVIGAELLAGVAYRAGPTKEDVRRAAADGRIPGFLAQLDNDLRSVLERGLASEPAQRIASAGELCAVVDHVRVERRAVAGAADLRALMRELFPDEIQRQGELLSEALNAAAGKPAPETVVLFSKLDAEAAAPAPSGELTEVVRVRLVDTGTVATARRRPLLLVAAFAVLALTVAGAALLRLREEAASPLTLTLAPAPTGGARPSGAGSAPPTTAASDDTTEAVQPAKPERPVAVEPKARPASKAPLKTTRDKLKLLERCKQRCAPVVIDKHARFGSLSLDEARGLAVELDACVKRCR